VAVYRGTADQLAFDRALQTVGLSERNMQVINLDWSAGKAALAAGRVDAVWGGVSLLALRGDKIDVVVKAVIQAAKIRPRRLFSELRTLFRPGRRPPSKLLTCW
jgi:ABC-type nitrate/sulfonate/bicarbonate transport system substrate-binding protein